MELQKLKTTYCELKEAQCLLNGNSLNIAHIVVGDGNGTIPTLSKDMTSLVNQRLQLNITVDDSSAPKYKFIADIPNDAEEFAIRELGITDSDNKLLYVAQMDGTNTNIIKQGISKQLRLQMLFTPANGVNIVVVDPSVITASTDFCNENFQKLSQKSQPSGYASLDTTGKVPKSELPDFSEKLDITAPQAQAPYLKTSYINGTSGYNIWSNGYCEQWGVILNARTNPQPATTLLKQYVDINYTLQITPRGSSTRAYTVAVYAMEVDSFQTCTGSPTNTGVGAGGDGANLGWKTGGYLAEGEY